ncbi:MAG: hypothetical protein JNK15_16345 [Planctomycetes bacterium]|nr:hypothetical protein [Planctomycetota bacterium]
MNEKERLPRPEGDGPLDTWERFGRELVKWLPMFTSAPWLGIPLGWLDRMVSTRSERATNTTLQNHDLAIRALQRRGVDVDALARNEVFVDFVFDALAAAMRTHREEKRVALRNAIVNSVLPGAPGETKARAFLRFVDELDVAHLLLLHLMADAAAFLKHRGLPLPGPASNRLIEMDVTTQIESPRSLQSIVNNVLRDELPHDLHYVVLDDLMRRGLTDGKATFNTLCCGQPLVSSLGAEFLRFISEAPDA